MVTSSKFYSTFVFAFLGALWGVNFLFMKMAVQIVQPLQVVWLRVLFGCIPIVIFSFARHEFKMGDWRKFPHFIVMALVANALPFYCFVKATQYIQSGIAGVFSGCVPLLTALFALFFLPSDRLTSKKAFGLTAGFVGVGMVAHLSSFFAMGLNDDIRGAGYMVLGALSYATAMVYAKKYLTPLQMSASKLAAYQTLIAALILFVFTPIDGIGALWDHGPAMLAVVVGLGVLGTGFAFIMYYFLIDRLGAITASSVYYIPPLVALAVGVGFNNESASGTQVLGMFAIISGIYFARNGEQK